MDWLAGVGNSSGDGKVTPVLWRRVWSRWGRDEKGQATFELIGYVFAVMVVAVFCVEAVYVSQAAATVQHAARDGARAYTLGESVESAVDNQLPDWIEEKDRPSVTFPTTSSVKVEVQVDVPIMLGSRRVGTWTVSRSAEMPTVRRAPSIPALNGPAGVSGMLDPSTLCRLSWAPAHMLRCDAAAKFEELNAAYRARFGTDIPMTDSYRTYAAQVALYQVKPTMAARPGNSNHGWGIAVDLGGGIEKWETATHQWMEQNAPAFGWYNPPWAKPGGAGPTEAWHWEFRG
ncbi:MAG: M15 family metallopeptidase [Micrococcales bacterium]|nr:M15 family metallopeptidase [Micrococcales bacterium]MCL2667282.1 M15 family metallopeptidase [Micrococcales bacterium]